MFGEPLICAELKNPCENTKTILPPTTAIATKRSVAITGATALLEVNLYFDCSFVISEFLRIEKGVKEIFVQNGLQLGKVCVYVIKWTEIYLFEIVL